MPTTTLERIPRVTFRNRIADALRRAIIDGSLAPGSVVSEAHLAARFDVSRAPLREALSQLVEEGLLISVPYTGTRVLDLTEVDLQEIQSMRVTLERFAFEQAWPRRDAHFRRELKARHAALTRTIDAGDDAASIERPARWTPSSSAAHCASA
jgi:DNA-binding GntR family transcriptional regulator